MGILATILSFLSAYPFSVSLAGAFFGGEETILSLAYLSGQGLMPVSIVFVACLVGTVASDSFWFYAARHKFVDQALKYKYFSKGYSKAASIFYKSFKSNLLVKLLLIKFMYGLRIVTMFYLSREKMSFKEFSFYNTIVIFIWLIINVVVGWSAGRGFSKAINILADTQKGLMLLIALIILINLFKWLFNKLFIKEMPK